MFRLINIISVCVLFMMAAVTLGAFTLHHWINESLHLTKSHTISVDKGDTLGKIAYQLESDGVLDSARWFILYARATGKTKVKVGEYLLEKGSNHQQLLDLLNSGNVISYSVTLVEGKTFNDFLASLHRNDKIIPTLKGKNYQEILDQLKINVAHPEGWFFPDTYRFVRGTTDQQILLQAYQKMRQVLDKEWLNKANNLPYNNAYEALIMASIIEKETGVAHEREEIAGVFVRRLQKPMRLQTDPTVIYGLGESYQGNIRRKHLTQKTAYNTYMIDGLPPTPIAMPGREAIYAALHPKAGKSLYFVAKGDGSHYFSSTLQEHNKAVRQYQLKRRVKNYRSSPQSN